MLKDFLLQNWAMVLLVIVVFIVIPLYFVVQGKWKELRQYALRLIRIAEYEMTGNKVGQDKFNFVLNEIYNMIVPITLRPFITKSKVSKQLQIWFYDVKDYLDDGIINDSYVIGDIKETNTAVNTNEVDQGQ